MRFVEDIYCDFLYDCYIANQRLTEEDWLYYGKETHHLEIPKCQGGELTPLNSQDLTSYQHWVAGVLQSEIVGRKCFAMVPKGVLPPMFEELRLRWQAHHNRTAKFPLKSREEYAEMGRNGGKKNKGKPGRKLTDAEIQRFRQYASLPKTEEHRQKLRENYYDISGWIWITNGSEETMVPSEFVLPPGWIQGRRPISDETKKKMSKRKSGEGNPMFGVTPKTKQMKWFKNLEQVVEKMFIPGEEPSGWVKGRLTARDRR